MVVERVLDVGVGGDAGIDGVPSAEIEAGVAGGVVDAEAIEIGVGAATDEACADVSAPAGAEPGEEAGGGVFGAEQEGVSGIERETEGARWGAVGIVEGFGRGVGVGGGELELARDASLHFELGSVSERTFEIEELILASRKRSRFDLVVEEVIEVGGADGPAASEKFLLETGLEGSSALGQEGGMRSVAEARFAEHLIER